MSVNRGFLPALFEAPCGRLREVLVILLISLFIEKIDYFFDVFLSTDWKFREISTLFKDIKSAVVLHQNLRVVSRHH